MDLGIGGLGYATEIGAGASAIVYKARQLDLDREVAVKVLSVTDEAFVRRFRREAKTLGKLSQNPGIVTVYDTGVTAAGQPYLILELCGASVLDQLNSDGTFEPIAACMAAAQVADAVADAHENGVVHRDLKPGNVLVSQTGRYMVTDFGISTVTGATMGQTNSVGFTAGYVAPETLTGEPVGAPSDVYALGATLFHMVAGRAPFVATEQSANLLALAQRVVNDPVPDLRPDGVPDQVCDVIEAAMAKKPDQRPTAAELRDLLLEVAGEPVGSLSGAPAQSASADGDTAISSTGISVDEALADDPELGQETVAGLGAAVGVGQATTAFSGDSVMDGADVASADATYVASNDATVGMVTGVGPTTGQATGPGGADIGLGQGTIGMDSAAAAPPQPNFAPPPPSGPSTPDPSVGGRHILNEQASPAALPPTPEERRYLYTTDDSRQLGPLIVGAVVGLLALIGVGAFLVSQTGGDSNDEEESGLTETVGGPTSSASPSGNEATGQDGSGGRSNLPSTSTSESTTTTEVAPVQVPIPDVTGFSAAEAARAITAVGLVVNQVDEESTTVPVGNVIRQNPSSATLATEGDVISIYVSTEGEVQTIDIPRLAGLTAAEATDALADAGLTATLTRENSDSVPENNVISSSPDVGTTVNVGSVVTLLISDGPPEPVCADVVGTTESAATAKFEAAGLTVSSSSESSSTVANGLVISCTQTATTATLTVSTGPPDPCAGLVGTDRASARASLEGAGLTVTETATINDVAPEDQVLTCTVTGSTAALTYASAAPTTCPPVAGQTFAQARAALTAAGFADIERVDRASTTVPDGEVISCSVSGTTATLTVSTGAAQVAVPDVSGMTVAAGNAALTAEGLVPGTTTDMASALPAGQIIRTTPAGGTLVASGATVNLVVSTGPAVTVTVPNVIGSTQAAAVAAINAAGLTPSVVTVEVPAGTPTIGTVTAMSPAAAAEVAPNTTITLTVAVEEP